MVNTVQWLRIPKMSRKPTIRLLLVCVAIATSFLALAAIVYIAGSARQKESQLPENECNTGKITWGPLSPQFFITF